MKLTVFFLLQDDVDKTWFSLEAANARRALLLRHIRDGVVSVFG
jgi:hypothetical protein